MNPYLRTDQTISKAASYIYSIGILGEFPSGVVMKEPTIKVLTEGESVVRGECSVWINLYLDDELYFRAFGKKWLGLTQKGEIAYLVATQRLGPKGPVGDFGIPISQINSTADVTADVLILEPEDLDFLIKNHHRQKISLGTISFMEKVYKSVMDAYNSMKPEIDPLAVVNLLNSIKHPVDWRSIYEPAFSNYPTTYFLDDDEDEINPTVEVNFAILKGVLVFAVEGNSSLWFSAEEAALAAQEVWIAEMEGQGETIDSINLIQEYTKTFAQDLKTVSTKLLNKN